MASSIETTSTTTTLKNNGNTYLSVDTNDDVAITNTLTATSPTFTTPILGTPTSGTVTNLTGTASININGTVGATTPAAATVTSLNGGQLAGNRNIIINGAQEVDQRHAGASAAASSQYVTDRWKVQSNGGAGDAEQIDSTIAGFKSSLKYTADASIVWNQIGQQIEYKNYSHLVGKEVIISFYAKANNTNGGSTALTVRTRSATGEDAACLFSGANTDTSKTISTTAARYTATRTIPSDSKSFSLEFGLGSHVSTDGYEITGIQIEEGSVATPFEHRSYGTELALCQRYCQVIYPAGDQGFAVGFNRSTTLASTIMTLPTEMRAAPTVTFSAQDAFQVHFANSIAQSTAMALGEKNTKAITINATVASGLTAGQGIQIREHTAGAWLNISAEL